jgi:hypothetical protein
MHLDISSGPVYNTGHHRRNQSPSARESDSRMFHRWIADFPVSDCLAVFARGDNSSKLALPETSFSFVVRLIYQSGKLQFVCLWSQIESVNLLFDSPINFSVNQTLFTHFESNLPTTPTVFLLIPAMAQIDSALTSIPSVHGPAVLAISLSSCCGA